jgi:hypothetical protein
MHVFFGPIHDKFLSGNCPPSSNRSVPREAPSGRAEPAPAAPARLQQMVDRRLEVTRRGLEELQTLLRAGQIEDAEVVLDKLNEDLHLLRRRLRSETEQ